MPQCAARQSGAKFTVFSSLTDSALDMQLRRTAQAIDQSSISPLAIQNGNSLKKFTAKVAFQKCFQFKKRRSPQVVVGWNLGEFFPNVILLLLVLLVNPVWSQFTMNNEKATLKDSTAGAGTIYIFQFVGSNALPSNGKILLTFPMGFNIANAIVATNIDNLEGGFEVSVDIINMIVTLERDGTGPPLSAGVIGQFKIALVGNPIIASQVNNPYKINIRTQENGGNPLDEGEADAVIKAGALDQFAISPNLSNQTAGAIPAFAIFGKDAFNNNQTFSGQVALSDSTDTITPKTATMNGTSVSVPNAQITKARNNVRIIASGGGKSGASNNFNVLPGAVAKFAFSPIDTSQEAGVPFPVTITAQDAFGNTATTFNGQSVFQPSAEVSPTQSGNFVNGMRAENIIYKKSGTKKKITANDNNNHSGSSSDFTVKPGKPSGTIILTANPSTLVVNSNTRSRVISAKIRDTQTNPVGKDRLFTLSVNNSAFGVIDTAQVASTNDSSWISFPFKAGSTSGAAIITATSVDNSAVKGNATINMNQLKILAIETASPTVSQRQRNAQVTMRVQNFGPNAVTVDSAKLNFSINSGDYNVTPLTTLPTIPGNGTIQTLKFGVKISITAQTVSTIINGQIFGKLPGNTKISDLDADTTDTWTAQTPANLSLTLKTSQPAVTFGQTQPWQVTLRVKNSGESVVKAVFEGDIGSITRTSLIDPAEFTVTRVSTNDIIAGKDSTDMVFEVTKTLPTIPTTLPKLPDVLTINGQVFASEINSDSSHAALASTQLAIQPSDSVVIASLEFDEVFNKDLINPLNKVDTVNTEQTFQVKVAIKQTVLGAEKVDSVRVSLAKEPPNGDFSIISPTVQTLADLNQFLYFKVKAGTTASLAAQFKANIVQAYSKNTRANTVKFFKSSRNIFFKTQKPGELQIDSLRTSEKTVRFGRVQPPWGINLFLSNITHRDDGGAVIIDSSKVNIKINGATQNDYLIQNIKTPKELRAGRKDTLKYQVIQTGYTGGVATLSVTLYARDKNSNKPIVLNESTAFTVESSALVKILRADFPAATNRVVGSDIALVNTSQNFAVEVTVENTGLEVIDTAYVSLTKSGNSTLMTQRAKAVAITTNGGTAKALFSVKAANAVNLAGEIFTARLDSAITRNKAKAAIGVSGDTTATARIELPARLQLSLPGNAPNDTLTLTTKQIFTLRAVVKNLGQAQTDNSGKLKIVAPDTGFKFINPIDPAQNFITGDTVKWQMRAPLTEKRNTTLRAVMSPRPRSKNSGDFAAAVDTVAILAVNIVNSLLQIDSTFVVTPAGAKDRTISTEQFFAVSAKIKSTGDLTNKTATLTLPAGYSFRTGVDSTQNVSTNGAVSWEAQAPTEAQSAANLKVKVKAVDGQSQSVERQSTLSITAKSRAILNLNAGLSDPPGTRGGTVSIGQAFTIAATLANSGDAKLNGAAKVKLDVAQSPGLTVDETATPLERTIFFRPDSQVQTITWAATAATQASNSETLIFVITQLPLDENTGKAAPSAKNPVTLKITISARGSLTARKLNLIDPAGAQDSVLSTGQIFTVSDTISWINATNVSARLMMPAGFSTETATKFITDTRETGKDVVLFWKVSAPASPLQNAVFKIYLEANDSHDQTVALKDSSQILRLRFEERADPQLRVLISNPVAARDGVVSVGQPFEVTATLINKGQAGLTGAATVSLDSTFLRSRGYVLVNPSAPEITSNHYTFVWQIRARPDIPLETDLIPFRLDKAPLDVNTNQPASSTLSQFSLAVRTEGRKFVVETVEKGGGPAVRGQQNFLLMRLLLTNPAGPGASNLVLKALSFDLRNRDGGPVGPNAALKEVRVMRGGDPAGEVTPNNQALQVTLQNVVITTATPDTISIFADLVDNATEPNFRVIFDHSQDLMVEDQDGGNGVAVETSDGRTLTKFRLESNLTAFFDADPGKSFFNYPNPFQPGNDKLNKQGTHFAYNLLEATSGELKIFTLLGELVWETSFSEAEAAGRAGPHTTDIFWDGRNGAGKRVLNGVYIAMLRLKGGKTLTTKVAVLKK